MSGRLRALITNDDGISSEGLRRLALLAVEAGLDVVVAAPDSDLSGSSASLIAVRDDGRVIVEPSPLAGLDGVPAFAVAGAPAFITLIAIRGAFGPPPDLVLSGINNGPNVGKAIIHSGTVGAALTGASRGCRAMAVSTSGQPPNWDVAVEVARQLLPALVDAPPETVVNVNAPDAGAGQLRGVRNAQLADFGAVQTTVSAVRQGYVQLEVVDIGAEQEPESDVALLAAGWATVTSLQPMCSASTSDFNLRLAPAERHGGRR